MADIDVLITQEPIDVTISATPVEVTHTLSTTDITVTQTTVDIDVTQELVAVEVTPVVVEVVVGDVPAHEAETDPHPQYLTQAEADLLYASITSGGGTPATTVETETTYGQASAVGTSTDYARADHTHGTPTEVTRDTLGLAQTDSPSFVAITLNGEYSLGGGLYFKDVLGNLRRLYCDGDGNIGTELA